MVRCRFQHPVNVLHSLCVLLVLSDTICTNLLLFFVVGSVMLVISAADELVLSVGGAVLSVQL